MAGSLKDQQQKGGVTKEENKVDESQPTWEQCVETLDPNSIEMILSSHFYVLEYTGEGKIYPKNELVCHKMDDEKKFLIAFTTKYDCYRFMRWEQSDFKIRKVETKKLFQFFRSPKFQTLEGMLINPFSVTIPNDDEDELEQQHKKQQQKGTTNQRSNKKNGARTTNGWNDTGISTTDLTSQI